MVPTRQRYLILAALALTFECADVVEPPARTTLSNPYIQFTLPIKPYVL